MDFELDYRVMPEWPVLSWLAVCERGAARVSVYHGARVETRPDWFCEAVWDGDFADGGFDRTDFVFGSGARCRIGTLRFVASGTSLDRLNVLERDRCFLVSNSLACVLAVSGAEPDPGYSGYVELFETIQNGIVDCARQLPLVEGAARLVYFHNLVWDGGGLREVAKEIPGRDLSGYDAYIGVLERGLAAIAGNMACPQRTFSYSWQGTISRGYDSPATAVLAKDLGLLSVLSFHEGRPGIADDGREIARALGLEVEVVDRLRWQEEGLWEPLFLSADGQGKEVFLAAARDKLRGRVLLTGFGGDSVWARNPKHLGQDLVRGNHSGLSMAEFRLHAGFIHLAVPFMGMTRIADVAHISQSPEMAPWDTGGAYSRPIPRRLVEGRGVARGLFGTAKTGTSMRYVIGHDAWSANGRRAYTDWILAHPSLPAGPLSRRLLIALMHLHRGLLWACDLAPPSVARRLRQAPRRLARALRRLGQHDYPFLWGMDVTRRSYPFPKEDRAGLGGGS